MEDSLAFMPTDTDKVNILVVDDLPEKVLVYQSVLEELGQNILCASSGAEALRMVLQHDFAVILLDVYMPEMDGFETATLIRKRKRSSHTPIIFITSYHDEVRTAQGYAHGAVDYIPAPVVPEILRAKIKVFVELYRMRQQVARQAEERARRLAAEESAQRSAFLARASGALSSSLDSEALLARLAGLAVPFLADLAIVSPEEEGDRPGRSQWAWTLPGQEAIARSEGEVPILAPWLREAVERVRKTGELELFSELEPPLSGVEIQWAARETERPLHPEFPLRSAMAVPLKARGKSLGALVLARGPSGLRYHATEVDLAEDLAGRAAIAFDNGLLVREILEADQRKTEFLSMLAHELRNPLAPIRNGIQLLRHLGSKDPGVIQIREMIDRQSAHMVRLVDDLLDVSRITSGKIRLQPVPILVTAVVARALETSRPLIEARKQEFTVSLPEEELLVNGDPDRLAQVLANLLNNAAKYTREGGRIEIRVGREGEEAVFRVRDSGVGMPREMLSKVFDLFTQVNSSLDRSQGGLGIGLTLVRRLVEMHQGKVQALSEGPGLGSEFVVRLPALAGGGPVRTPTNGARNERCPSPSCRVLVVDDNLDAAESLSMLLQIAGHEVRLAHDGPGALDAAAEFQPEMVLLDIGLPGLDGFEVARRLRSAAGTRNAVLVALTGYGEEEFRRRSTEVGFDGHLVKPVDLQALEDLLAGR